MITNLPFFHSFFTLFCSSLKNNNVNKNNGQNSIPHFQRSRSLYNPGGLKKKPLSHLKKSRTLSTDETNNSTADSTDVLLPRYKQMKCITMEVKRSSFGRKGKVMHIRLTILFNLQ